MAAPDPLGHPYFPILVLIDFTTVCYLGVLT